MAIKATALTGWQVASFRSGIAALAVLALVPATRRGWNRGVLLVALAFAMSMILFVVATKLTTAANAILAQSAAPLYVLVLSPLLLRERVTRADIVTMAVVCVGLLLVIGGSHAATATAPDPGLGNTLGALSGVAWALTVIGLRWLGAREGGANAGAATIVAGNALAFAICLPFALPVVGVGMVDWAVLGYLGVFQIGLAYLLVTRGVRGVPALEASVLMLIEPALNPLWVWLLLGEAPAARSLLGGALILSATIARSWVARR